MPPPNRAPRQNPGSPEPRGQLAVLQNAAADRRVSAHPPIALAIHEQHLSKQPPRHDAHGHVEVKEERELLIRTLMIDDHVRIVATELIQDVGRAGQPTPPGPPSTVATAGGCNSATGCPFGSHAEARKAPGTGYLEVVGLVEGLLRHSRKLFHLPEGFYPMETIFLVLAFMAMVRVRSLEALRYEPPGEWGQLVGLNRIPELRTMREKLARLGQPAGVAVTWNSELAREWNCPPAPGGGTDRDRNPLPRHRSTPDLYPQRPTLIPRVRSSEPWARRIRQFGGASYCELGFHASFNVGLV